MVYKIVLNYPKPMLHKLVNVNSDYYVKFICENFQS